MPEWLILEMSVDDISNQLATLTLRTPPPTIIKVSRWITLVIGDSRLVAEGFRQVFSVATDMPASGQQIMAYRLINACRDSIPTILTCEPTAVEIATDIIATYCLKQGVPIP